MQIRAAELCALLNGRLEGNPDAIITHPAKIEEGGEGAVCFLANPKYLDFAYTTKASVLVANESEVFTKPVQATIIRVPDAYAAFTFLLQKFGSVTEEKRGIEQPSFIHSTVQLGDNIYIGAFAYLGARVKVGNHVKIYPHCYIGDDCEIGDHSVLYPGVQLYHQTKLGKYVIVHSGTVIGSDGFGFAPQKDGTYSKIPQLGNVIIEDDVELGSCVTIDRATMGSTVIRRGVKLDNQVHVAHNVEIGEHTVIAAQSGISGSTKIGKHCMIGGQVGFVGHISIADGSRINAQSGVSKSIKEPNKAWNGAPAFEYTASLRSQSVYRNLPDLVKQFEELKRQIEQQ